MILAATISTQETKAQWLDLGAVMPTIEILHQAYLKIAPVIPSLQAIQCKLDVVAYLHGDWFEKAKPTEHSDIVVTDVRPDSTDVSNGLVFISHGEAVLQVWDGDQFVTSVEIPIGPQVANE